MFDYEIGKVVCNNNYNCPIACITKQMYGHITGFRINALSEYVLTVKWANGQTSSVHPAALTFKE